MKTVIMAGGKGTRISSVASDIPKPMIKINGKPVLEWELKTYLFPLSGENAFYYYWSNFPFPLLLLKLVFS